MVKKYGTEEWRWVHSCDRTIFFGMYHPGDYARYLWQRGPKTVAWMGSDIRQLPGLWANLLRRAEHICENEVEQAALEQKGIKAKVRYIFSEAVSDFPNFFTPSKRPHVWSCIRPGRELEYGLGLIKAAAAIVSEVTFHVYGIERQNEKNVIYHGKVPNKLLNTDIRRYHCGLRLNRFDGFSEVTAKSILLGQYPITMIKYPRIDCARSPDELLLLLRALKDKDQPNPARVWWRNELNRPL
jgi:hypothetical protein